MIFTKDIEKITFADVIVFCEQRPRENINLDYKKEIAASLNKTIAAMANTWGGMIIIGVEDEDSMPKLPVEGISYEEHLRERINNLILGNITPPIFPEIQVCQSDDKQKALIVIRVPQSNMTPHAINNNTKVYLRTDTSNEPEELAKIDHVLWLVDKREKSTDLKEYFFTRADERFNNLCRKAGTNIDRTDVFIAMCPVYPFKVLIDYNKLQRDIPNQIGVKGWGYYLPRRAYEYCPTQDGAYEFYKNETSGYVRYEELNHYGFYYSREDLCHTEKREDGKNIHNFLLWDILTRTDLFFEMMSKFYSLIGYWGLLEVNLSLSNIEDVNFLDLPVIRGYMRFDNITSSPIDKKLEFKKEISFQQLNKERVPQVIGLVREIGWALGFTHITNETITQLMKENGRLQ